MPRRIQRKRTKGWRKPDGAVVVTRPCEWSNPFKAGDTIAAYDRLADRPARVTVTPALAVELFRAAVAERGWHEQIRAELEGRDLVCWCPLDAPCHADVLLEIANPPDSDGVHLAEGRWSVVELDAARFIADHALIVGDSSDDLIRPWGPTGKGYAVLLHDPAELSRAYRLAAKRLHPDTEGAAPLFARLQDARDTILSQIGPVPAV